MENAFNLTNDEIYIDHIAVDYARICLELILVEAKIESLAVDVLFNKNYKHLNKLVKLNKKHNNLSLQLFFQNEYLKSIA